MTRVGFYSLDAWMDFCLTGNTDRCASGRRTGRRQKGHCMTLLQQLANPEAGDLSDVVDLDRYPIHEPGSAAWRQMIDEARRHLSDDGCLVLPDFLRPAALELAAEEIASLAQHAPIREHTSTVYARGDIEASPTKMHFQSGP